MPLDPIIKIFVTRISLLKVFSAHLSASTRKKKGRGLKGHTYIVEEK
jgi:hypothetical protein